MSTEQTALRFIRGPQARNSDQMAVISHLILNSGIVTMHIPTSAS